MAGSSTPSSSSPPAPQAPEGPASGRLRYLALIVPLAIIVAVILLVYRNYSTQRERYFTDHYLRSLAALAGQIEGAVAGLGSSVDGAVLAWQRRADTLQKICAIGPTVTKGQPQDCTPQAVCRDLGAAITDQLALVPVKLSKTVPPEVLAGDAAPPSIVTRTEMKRLDQTRDSPIRAASDTDEPPLESANTTLYFCRETPQPLRKWATDLGCDGVAAAAWTCAQKDLGDLVRPLLQAGTFDTLDVVVLDDTGKARFERGKSGVRLATLRPSTAAKPADTAGAEPSGELPALEHVMAQTVVHPFNVDGAAFKVFSQPLRIAAGSNGEQVTWAVGVLTPLGAVDGDERRIPLLVIGGIPALLLLGALVLPFLQIVTISSREALTGVTAFGVAVALLTGSAVVTIGTLDWLAWTQTRERLDHELVRFAGALEDAFSAELDLALTALADFRATRGAPRLQPNGLEGGYVTCEHVLAAPFHCRCEDPDECPLVAMPAMDRVAPWALTYPSFDLLVLTDTSGRQREKWTTAELATPPTEMAAYSAHKDPMSGRLLPRAGEVDRGYALNVMTSPNTGQVLNVLSVPIAGADGQPDGVALMVGHFLSLHDPVVAPDMAFAVIDRSGRVVFHSHQRRRLYENFFAESSGDLRMRSALFARQAGLFDLDYRGQPQRVYVQPLRDTAWSLVVLRDRDSLSSLGIEVGALSLSGFMLLAALYSVAALLGRWLLGPALGAALWPDPRAAARYRLLLAPLVMLPMWMMAVLARDDRAGHLAVIVVGPLIALGVVLLTVALGHATTRRWLVGAGALLGLILVAGWINLRLFGIVGALIWLAVTGLLAVMVASWEPSWLPANRPSVSRCARRYAALALLLLFTLGALPAAAIFRDAFVVGAESMIRARQIKLSERLEQSRLEFDRRATKLTGGDDLRRFWQEHRPWIESGLTAFEAAAGAGEPPRTDSRPVTRDVAAVLSRLDPALCGPSDAHNGNGPSDPCGVTAFASHSWCAALGRHFTTPLLYALPVYTQESIEHRHMIFRAAADGSWAVRDGDGAFCARARFASRSEPLVQLSGWNLGLGWPQRSLAIAVLVLAALLVGYGLWRLLGWVLARLFCLDVWDAVELDSTVASSKGAYYLRPLPATLDALCRRPGTTVLDLRTVARADDLLGRLGPHSAGRVLILHLEHEIDSADWNRQKLELLEELLIRRGVAVDIVSEVGLLGYFSRRIHSPWDRADDSYVSPREMERWAQVLAQLDKQCADLPPAPLPPRPGNTTLLYDECRWTARLRGIRAAIAADPRWTGLSPEALLQHIGDLADAHYRTVWYLLTDEERLVLYHLAVRGFVNPKNRQLARRLMRRGLIRRAPALRVMNETFRRFVQQVEDRATVRAWERAAGASAWTWVRNGVLAVVVIVAVLLFITRPATYTRWVALLTAMTTLGGGMAQLLGLFQTSRQQRTG